VTVGQVIGRIEAGGAVADSTEAENEPAAREAAADSQAASDGAAASPVARRAADAHSVDLTTVAGSGPRGRVTKADVLDAAGQPATKAMAAASMAIKGGAAMLVHYMEESRKIRQRRASARSRRHPRSAARPTQASRQEGFLHAPDRVCGRPSSGGAAVMAQHFAEIDAIPHRLDDGAVNLGLAVDVERRTGHARCWSPSCATPATWRSTRS